MIGQPTFALWYWKAWITLVDPGPCKPRLFGTIEDACAP